MATTDRTSSARLARLLGPGLALGMLQYAPAAFAGDAIVTPMLSSAAYAKASFNISSMLSSEADFLGVFELVDQLDAHDR